MEFIEKNWKLIAGLFIGVIIIGFTLTFLSYSKKNKEELAQEKLAKIELDYTKYKDDFAKSKSPISAAKDKKTDLKESEKIQTELVTKVNSSRLKLIEDLKQFTTNMDKSIACQMASLYLSELLIDNKNSTEALEVLKKSQTNSSDLTAVLIDKKIGALLADANQCDEAMKVWDKILKTNTAKFAFSEVKIMQALCYQKMNNPQKAEELLTSIKNDKTEGSAESVQHAEKILRLIHFKKASGT